MDARAKAQSQHNPESQARASITSRDGRANAIGVAKCRESSTQTQNLPGLNGNPRFCGNRPHFWTWENTCTAGLWLAGKKRMEKNTETTIMGLGFRVRKEKKVETTILGYIGTTIRIHSFIPS